MSNSSKVFYEDYRQYLLFQQSEAERTKERTLSKERTYLNAFKKLKKRFPKAESVLLLGCRNDFEIEIFEKFGYKKVVGIDLIEGKKIIVCDFAKILSHPILKDQKFDLFLSFDSVEHCLDWPGLKEAILKNCLQGVYFETHSGHKIGRWDCASHSFTKPTTNPIEIEKEFEGFKIEELSYTKPHHKNDKENKQWRLNLTLKRWGI